MEPVSKQLIFSTQDGRLKPDVRLGVAVSEFAQILDDDRKRDFQKMQTAGTQLSGRDAIRLTEELNRDSERRHSTWRPYGTKCGKFLDRLQTLANIGDVMIGGSQNVIATSIWCAVRLSLQTATNFRGYFERLSSLFMKLGTSWELHNDFAQIFPQSEALQTLLCEYLIVLMRLCRKAVLFSNKSLAGQLWSSLGASFDSEFKPLQEEMDKLGSVIQYKTQQLAMASVVDADKFRRRDYKQRTLHVLSPNQPQHVTTWRRHRRKGDCKWIYQTTAYRSWIAEDASSTLCVTGKLGSGKTVTMANIVAQVSMEQPCAFFFCTFKEPESLKAATVLGSIAFHLLDSIPVDRTTWDSLTGQEDTISSLSTSTSIIDAMINLLPEEKKYVVVIDGLEGCPQDEITEVVSGLHRFMARRAVLLCYAARSGSMFERLIAQKLPAQFSLSLDNQMHHEAIKAYIVEEIARRKQEAHPGLITDELEKMVEKHLLAGAQGMYLWVALQLNSIFPSQSMTVVTYGQILNLINNLPKDLPEAFERALEGIIDDRYGSSIMKIILAARSPLTLDELKVALTVVPGDPVWYAARVPTDATQLIALCGGSLLELDEEDGKVRFIHYSVVNHLLRATKNPGTMRYHFSMQEAEIQAGAICVTFLNMPMFQTDVTMTKKVTGEQLAEKVIGAVSRQQPLLVHLAHHFKKRNHSQSIPTNFDIGRLMAEIQAAHVVKFDPRCFQSYAVSNWLPHSRSFEMDNPVCLRIRHSWMRLLCGNVQVATTPFRNPMEEYWPVLSWALIHHHKALFHMILEDPTTEPNDGEKLSREILELAYPSSAKRYDRSCLGNLLVHSFQLCTHGLLRGAQNGNDHGMMDAPMPTRFPPMLWLSSKKLMDLGADPTVPHARNGHTVLKMLLATLGQVSEESNEGLQLRELLEQVLAHDNTQPLLQSAWVPYSLRKILENGNSKTLASLLVHRPEVYIPSQEDSLIGVAVAKRNVKIVAALLQARPRGDHRLAQESYIHCKPVIQLALETHNREVLVLLARHGGLNPHMGIDRLSAPLLRIAVEKMSAEWVELLLDLGADPNLSYPVVVPEAAPRTESRYHLQTAAAEGQTLKFLILIRHGASTFLPLTSYYEIVAHRGNRVLTAKLKEIESSKAADSPPWDSPFLPTTLLEACRILAENLSEDQVFKSFGVVQSPQVATDTRRQELKLILLELAKTTPRDQLDLQCPHGNTALHYLTGGMDRFHREALDVATYLLDITSIHSLPTVRNKYGQTPLQHAVDRASQHGWEMSYLDSVSFLIARI